MAGEVVKAAAKLTGTGVPVVPGGIRGKGLGHLPVSSSARMPFSARPAAAVATSGEEAADEPMPRVVFHGDPTLEEAKEATSELIIGLEEIYPWSRDYDGYENSVTSKHELDKSLSNSQVEQANASSSVQSSSEPAVPTTVYMAFRLLRESTVAQNVVASIASDPNVVKAVRENQQLQEFLHSERRRWISSHSVTGPERLDVSYAENIEDSSNYKESKPRISVEDLLKTIKDMVDMIQNLSGLFKEFFGHEGAAKSSANGDHGAHGASSEHVVEASLLGLAIMVIMLVLLKRG
ncbi:hypothetical protein F511_31320 [Dorcoceras hygrometricum]|uniref:Uncharacterized protein n=1 Tax=Dorcoceras hygrometricum TaxID=472368 RepID=A0A2Z7D7B4_9LAMI|nr:hypothetical protein F511_31320 [Dorcoceras hygrometricum]